jgi:hypothetical protein
MDEELTIAPVAEELECSIAWVKILCARGDLPCRRIQTGPGRSMRIFKKGDVEKFKAKREAAKVNRMVLPQAVA